MSFKYSISHSAIISLLSVSLAACGGGGSGNTGGTTAPSTPVVDTTAPTFSFSSSTMTVISGQSQPITITVNDSSAASIVPTVSCTNGGSFAGGVFTAPVVTENTISVCTVVAQDPAGNEGTGSFSVTLTPPPPPDTTGPTLTFSPSTATVISGQTQNITLTASDAGSTAPIVPTVSCTNGGSFAGGVFTAAAVTQDTISVCTATAQDAAGNEGTGTLTVTMMPAPPDTAAPVLSFNPATLSVISGGTGNSALSASDNVAITSGPTVTCTNNGSFANGVFTAPSTPTASSSVCTAVAQDAAGNEGTATLTVNIAAAPAAPTISGIATYDFVPHIDNSSNQRVFPTALNYNAIEQRPIRGATVELVNASNVVLESATTDSSGAYSFEVDPNVNLRVRVRAEMVQTEGAQWDVRVQDNTSSDALYALQSPLQSSGTADTVRNLNAASGWNGTSYASARQAAPFAIMDQIYDAVTLIAAHDPDVVFPPARLNWSVDNRPVNGTLSAGEIGTSSYRGNGDIFILGEENNDTDEYDTHVVVHEWGHYFEDQLSRSDSIGGPHGGTDRLDPRVAMGEGFGNALSGMITGDPVYRDSDGPAQSEGFAFSVEENDVSTEGWFNETSVQSILYDLFDANSDAGDTLSLGIGPIYDVFVSNAYRTTPYFTTIFAYLDEFRSQFPANTAAINVLAVDRNVNGTGPDGAGETSDGTVASALPVYHAVTVNGGAVEICSVDDQGEFNKLGNRAYLVFNVTSPGVHTLTMTRNAATSTATNRDPDFLIYRNETFLGAAESGDTNTEQASANLSAGLHRVDAYDFFNLGISGTRGDSCYNFTVTR